MAKTKIFLRLRPPNIVTLRRASALRINDMQSRLSVTNIFANMMLKLTMFEFSIGVQCWVNSLEIKKFVSMPCPFNKKFLFTFLQDLLFTGFLKFSYLSYPSVFLRSHYYQFSAVHCLFSSSHPFLSSLILLLLLYFPIPVLFAPLFDVKAKSTQSIRLGIDSASSPPHPARIPDILGGGGGGGGGNDQLQP
jgi:hypothetical protein